MSEDDMDSEEEDMPVIGGEGFTPEELAGAEQSFTAQLVRAMSSCIGQRSCSQPKLLGATAGPDVLSLCCFQLHATMHG